VDRKVGKEMVGQRDGRTDGHTYIHTTGEQAGRQTADKAYGKLITVKTGNNGVSVCTHRRFM
jgi:hypothetical protein